MTKPLYEVIGESLQARRVREEAHLQTLLQENARLTADATRFRGRLALLLAIYDQCPKELAPMRDEFEQVRCILQTPLK